jgi:AcrR family transcriptional regulator
MTKARTSRRRGYHHGTLRKALIEATLKIIEESGLESVTVREAGARAGVSSGAPFRHFPNKKALLTAVAEEAMTRFRAEIVLALKKAPADDPIAQFRALGAAYMRWAILNPTHFVVISARSHIDFDGSELLRKANAEIQALMDQMLTEAHRHGRLRSADIGTTKLVTRGLVYGLARMYTDGHLPQWGVSKRQVQNSISAALDQFFQGLDGGPSGPKSDAAAASPKRSNGGRASSKNLPTSRPSAR